MMTSLFAFYEKDFNEKLIEIERRIKVVPNFTFERRLYELKLVQMDIHNSESDLKQMTLVASAPKDEKMLKVVERYRVELEKLRAEYKNAESSVTAKKEEVLFKGVPMEELTSQGAPVVVNIPAEASLVEPSQPLLPVMKTGRSWNGNVNKIAAGLLVMTLCVTCIIYFFVL